MSDTGPVCSCGTATVENPCSKHPEVEKEVVPNRRIEAKIEGILQALGYHTVRFQGHVSLVNQPGRLANLVGLFGQLLDIGDQLIEGMRFYLPRQVQGEDAEDTAYQKKELERIREMLKAWDAPLRLDIPPKAPKKGKKKS